MAPELYSTVTLKHGEKKHYNHKVDAYRFAIVLWELLHNKTPFEGMSNLQAAYAAAFKGLVMVLLMSLGNYGWSYTMEQVKHAIDATSRDSQNYQMELLSYLKFTTEPVFPTSSSILKLSKILSVCNGNMTTFSTIENKLVVIALIAMTVFFRTELGKKTTDDGSIYFGALFFGITTILFNGLAENALTIAKLPTFYKQRDLWFFPSWAYALPNWLLKIPVSFIEVGIWIFTTYFVMGFDPNVGRLFKQYLLLLLLHQMASGLFRFVASMGRSMIVSNTFGAFAMVTILSLGGFFLAREDVKKWWIWG